jgi:uncharacterized protein (TIGR00369 family)
MSTAFTHPPLPPPDGSQAQWLEWANGLPAFVELGLRCEQIDAGHALIRLERSVWTQNPNGGVNGGLVCAAADQAMGLVALTMMEAGALPATATLHAEFLRPAFAPLTFRAAVSQRGRRIVFVTVDVEDASGRLAVKCSGTMAAQSTSDRAPPPTRSAASAN